MAVRTAEPFLARLKESSRGRLQPYVTMLERRFGVRSIDATNNPRIGRTLRPGEALHRIALEHELPTELYLSGPNLVSLYAEGPSLQPRSYDEVERLAYLQDGLGYLVQGHKCCLNRIDSEARGRISVSEPYRLLVEIPMDQTKTIKARELPDLLLTIAEGSDLFMQYQQQMDRERRDWALRILERHQP